MRICIIGAGFTGLGVAYYLSKEHDITLIDSEKNAGGLAQGFKADGWNWYLDKLVHHWFATDEHALELVRNVGMGDRIILRETKSSCFKDGKIAELDSALSLLKFPFLNFFNRLRTGAVMAYFRTQSNWKKYENETSYDLLKKLMGKESFEVIWKPLFEGKFGKYADKVNGAFIWARINPRTKKLAYVKGGFQEFIDKIVVKLKEKGVKIILNKRVDKIERKGEKFIVDMGKKEEFDIVVAAIPLQKMLKITNGFPESYCQEMMKLKSLSCQYLILETEKSIIGDSYWLNINENGFPFMLLAEHTNFAGRKNYGNKCLTYVGKYLEKEDALSKLSKEELLEKAEPFLKKINNGFSIKDVKRSWLFRFDDAQPILPLGYSKIMPSIKTPIKGLYSGNMNHIYPWDRGTNNALEIAKRIVKSIEKDYSP